MSGHICEDGEADVAVGVDVLVQRDGVADERHLGHSALLGTTLHS